MEDLIVAKMLAVVGYSTTNYSDSFDFYSFYSLSHTHINSDFKCISKLIYNLETYLEYASLIHEDRKQAVSEIIIRLKKYRDSLAEWRNLLEVANGG